MYYKEPWRREMAILVKHMNCEIHTNFCMDNYHIKPQNGNDIANKFENLNMK